MDTASGADSDNAVSMSDRQVPRVVVLDATALVADRGLVGADAQALLIECRAGRRRVIVPEVALIEAVARHRRDVTEAVDGVAGALRRLHRIANVPGPATGADVEPRAESDAYEQMIRRHLDDFGVTVAPLPSISHGQLVRMAVDRRRPFQESGTGYRDALIWATVAEAARHEPVAFVTNNNRDFAAGRGDSAVTLHPDLVDGLPSAGAVRLWPTIGALVADLGTPDPQVLESLEAEFEAQGPLWAQLGQRFASEADGMDFGTAVDVAPEYPVLEALVLGVFDVHDITLSSVTSIGPDGSVLVDATVNADVEMQVTVLERHPEVRTGDGAVTVAVPLRCFGALWFDVTAVLEPDGRAWSHMTVNPDVARGTIDLSDYSPPTVAFS